MDRRIVFEKDGNAGEVAIRVEPAYLWELVEHLADRRVIALYTYVQGGFRVLFPRLSAQEAGRILDDFAACRRAAPPQQAPSPPLVAEAYLG